jgi:hemerythrin-like domain-containing protein
MCEYCGCQSLQVIADLTAEHDQLRELGRDLTDAVAADDRRAAALCASLMIGILEPHTAVEEGGLFPAMAVDYPEQIADLADDHRRIHADLHQIADGRTHNWASLAETAVAELFEHILKEQDGVFPASLSVLAPDQWERVAAVRAATPRPAVVAADG